MIQASVAVDSLQQEGYEAVQRASDALRTTGVRVEVQTMRSAIAGTQEVVFQALEAAYEAAASLGPTVMTVTISNACPTR